MSRARFHVIPHGGQWLVVRVGELFKGPYQTKDEAIGAAQVMALVCGSSQVLVYDLTGRVQTEAYYGRD